MNVCYSSETSKEEGLRIPGQIPKGIAKAAHCKKVMWCVWWDRSGIIHWEIISNGFWWDGESDERHEWKIPDKDGKCSIT